jgi:hypothetical protein
VSIVWLWLTLHRPSGHSVLPAKTCGGAWRTPLVPNVAFLVGNGLSGVVEGVIAAVAAGLVLGEVQPEAQVCEQPGFRRRGLVGGEVVEHDVDVQSGGHVVVDRAQERLRNSWCR